MALLDDAIKRIPAGRYIVAVSGGVDSMALLHALSARTDIIPIATHVNHGIRDDDDTDNRLIADFCASHNILFISTDLNLGKDASEALARARRYEFLQKCRIEHRARGIITAHHQDDMVETAIINILRGTGWRGIAPLSDTPTMLRPLLYATKSDIKRYASAHAVPWREDSTNTDQKYLRNYIRLSAGPWLDYQDTGWRTEIVRLIRKQQVLRRTIEDELNKLLSVFVGNITKQPVGSRYMWCMLPSPEAYELFQALCRKVTGGSIMYSQAQAALLFIRVAKPGKCLQLTRGWQLRVTRTQFIVEPR